jgi:transcriptional regulator with GAF, ATPase, and Fis domain
VTPTDSRPDGHNAVPAELAKPLREGFFEHRALRAAGFIITGVVAIAALVAVAIRLSGRVETGGWAERNQPVLMAVLVLTNLLFLAYVVYQERQVQGARRARHHRRLLGILTVSRTMGAETDPQAILDGITDICRKTYACDQVSLMRLDRDASALEVCSASGHRNMAEVLRSRTALGEGIAGWVAENRVPLILGPKVDPARFNGLKSRSHAVASAMIVPIILRDELFEVLSVSSRTKGARYDEDDLETLLVFAETAGIATRHAEQSTWMRQTIQRLDEELLRKDGGERLAA